MRRREQRMIRRFVRVRGIDRADRPGALTITCCVFGLIVVAIAFPALADCAWPGARTHADRRVSQRHFFFAGLDFATLLLVFLVFFAALLTDGFAGASAGVAAVGRRA